MSIPIKVVIECPQCGFSKKVTRGDSLPDTSMFQKCPKCGTIMVDSKKSVTDSRDTLSAIFGLFKK